MQACSYAVADRTHEWSKIPDVRAFDRCCDRSARTRICRDRHSREDASAARSQLCGRGIVRVELQMLQVHGPALCAARPP